MTTNPFLGDGLRPDQQKWASTQFGMVSPMWLPFIAAASVGAAWWGMTHWARVMGSSQSGRPAPASAGSASPSAVPLDQVSARSAAVAAPDPAPAPSPAAALAPAADALSESLGVQGEDDAADAASPETKAPAVVPAAQAAADSPAQGSAHAVAHDEHEKPAPTLPPHEGLPARKKSGGKKKAS